MPAIDWRQETIRVFGRAVLVPRLTAWYGTEPYTYSGIRHEAAAPPLLIEKLRERIGGDFNSVLCNLYRSGRDSVGWHSDDEPELGPEPRIASLSYGAKRDFLMRDKLTGRKLKLALGDGDLLVMGGTCQQEWEHSVPKRAAAGERINLTFRRIV